MRIPDQTIVNQTKSLIAELRRSAGLDGKLVEAGILTSSRLGSVAKAIDAHRETFLADGIVVVDLWSADSPRISGEIANEQIHVCITASC